jgi:hypothetical protein
MSDKELLAEISNKLSVLIGIFIQRDGQAKVQEHVERLSDFGLSGPAIAQILGTTTGTVAVAKNRLKKARSK